VVDQLDLK